MINDEPAGFLCVRLPRDIKAAGVCLLPLMMLVVWLVQTGIISSDNALITDALLPTVENSFSNQTNNTQAAFILKILMDGTIIKIQ